MKPMPPFEAASRLEQLSALDPAIDAEKITAEMHQGVLTLHLPKAERVKPRKIEIK